MLTFLVRVSLLSEAAAYAALGAWLHARHGWSAGGLLALALATALGLRLVLVLFTSFLGWRHRSPREPSRQLGIGGTVRLVASEYLALLADNFVYLPFPALAVRPDPVPSPAEGPAVVLVHGYLSNRGYFRPMVRWLEARGVAPVFVPEYRSVFADIEAAVVTLHAAIERIAAGTGGRVVLVCHSMGGLVARQYLRQHGEARVARLVTIASPHHGTAIARLGFGPHARQMECGSAFLEGLAQAERARSPQVPALSIYTVHDNLVSPQDTSRLAWARNAALAGVGHVGILASREAFELVLAELRAAGAVRAAN